jgi:hypothetical protein
MSAGTNYTIRSSALQPFMILGVNKEFSFFDFTAPPNIIFTSKAVTTHPAI